MSNIEWKDITLAEFIYYYFFLIRGTVYLEENNFYGNQNYNCGIFVVVFVVCKKNDWVLHLKLIFAPKDLSQFISRKSSHFFVRILKKYYFKFNT